MIGDLVAVQNLADAEIAAMYRLFAAHFDNVDEIGFRSDLAEKQWVVRVSNKAGLLGFTSLRFLRVRYEAEELSVVYSGDTIVANEARSGTSFARTWISAIRWLAQHYSVRELHWLLLVSGFRTYRFLPVFWREFLPSRERIALPTEYRRMQAAARQLFGDRYDADSGIVRFARPQICRADRNGIAPGRMQDPDVAYFVESNPGYADGDELVCWTRLTHDNLTAAGRRIVRACAPQPLAL